MEFPKLTLPPDDYSLADSYRDEGIPGTFAYTYQNFLNNCRGGVFPDDDDRADFVRQCANQANETFEEWRKRLRKEMVDYILQHDGVIDSWPVSNSPYIHHYQTSEIVAQFDYFSHDYTDSCSGHIYRRSSDFEKRGIEVDFFKPEAPDPLPEYEALMKKENEIYYNKKHWEDEYDRLYQMRNPPRKHEEISLGWFTLIVFLVCLYIAAWGVTMVVTSIQSMSDPEVAGEIYATGSNVTIPVLQQLYYVLIMHTGLISYMMNLWLLGPMTAIFMIFVGGCIMLVGLTWSISLLLSMKESSVINPIRKKTEKEFQEVQKNYELANSAWEEFINSEDNERIKEKNKLHEKQFMEQQKEAPMAFMKSWMEPWYEWNVRTRHRLTPLERYFEEIDQEAKEERNRQFRRANPELARGIDNAKKVLEKYLK